MIFGARTTSRKKLVFVSLFLCVLSVPSLGEQDGGANVLFGLAAMTSAASQPVVAGIKAAADVDINRDNNKTSKELAIIDSGVKKYGIDSTERITTQQNQLADKISERNSTTSLIQQAMVLSEQAAARNQENALKADAQKEEFALRRRELQEEELQRQANMKLAMMQLEQQKVLAGLTTGISPVGTTGLVKTGTTGAVSSATALNPSVGSQVARALGPRSKLFAVGKAKTVADRLRGFSTIAQGSTRVLKNRGTTDLKAFQASIAAPKIFRNDEGLRPHRAMISDAGYEHNTDVGSHQ